MSDHNSAEAINQLKQVRAVKSQNATQLFSAFAYAYMAEGEMDKARESVEKAKKWARTPVQIKQAETAAQAVESRAAAAPK